MKIAIFFGTFNPIHLGHYRIAKAVLERELVDKIWFIPPIKTFRSVKKLEPLDDRIAMIKKINLSIEVVDLREANKEIITDIEKLQWIKSRYPKHRFFFLCGSDVFIKAKDEIPEILKYTDGFIVHLRQDLREYVLKEIPENVDTVTLLRIKDTNISSTEIRERLSRNEDAKDLLLESVESYIKEKGLYQ